MADKLHFSLVSPERELFSGLVDQVDALAKMILQICETFGGGGKPSCRVAVAATLEGQAALLGFALGAEEPAPLTAPVKSSGGASGGEEVFASNCATCHTLAAAEATGQVGPNLDELMPSEKTVQTQVETGGDKMPSFKGNLSPEEIKAVATFVSKSAGKK